MNDFALTLLNWFRENGRDLPWRQVSDPYAIWLSEVILQQTQVKQGQDYWQRFMQRWPTVADLAAATEDEVLREWQGLGYYSRARNLRVAALQIVARGGFPQTVEGLKRLKGVGDYTAAAIASFAFGVPAAVVDGNVYRVLARHYGIATPIDTAEGKHEFAALAQAVFPDFSEYSGYSGYSVYPDYSNCPDNSGLSVAAAYNQAIMDFGATWCTPQSPRCGQCPLQETCQALRTNRVGQLPVKQGRMKQREQHLIYIYIRCNGYTALHRRPAGGIWQGLYEPLLLEGKDFSPQKAPTLSNGLSTHDNFILIDKNVKHVLTHRIIYADFYLWEPAIRPTLPSDFLWIAEEDIDHYAVPRLIERFLEKIKTILYT